ncbi:conserved hypothetical protein [Ricinus communis]|uniref:Uncharacterized protein n=1 Tax=Ricinus communis TaxID=3988 RepID=B9TGG6_RICCO|nr:conserved hypothetical protein [Ricinus communis]
MGHESPYLFPVIGNQATSIQLRDGLALVCDQARHIVTCARRTHGDATAMNIDLICRRIDRMLAIGQSNVEAGMEALTAMGTLHIKTLKFIRLVEQANLPL